MNVYESIVKSLNEASEYAGGNASTAREETVTVSGTSAESDNLGLSAHDAARWLIAYNNSRESSDLLTNLKLQKLLYYAQGTAIKYTGKPLFAENLIAWKLGPVVGEVYDKYKQYGRNPIDETYDIPKFDNNDIEVILQDVYDEYGQYSASKLVDMTHEESPWKDTLQSSVISIDKMIAFFAR